MKYENNVIHSINNWDGPKYIGDMSLKITSNLITLTEKSLHFLFIFPCRGDLKKLNNFLTSQFTV